MISLGALANNVAARTFNTPTKAYIFKQSTLVIQYETLYTVREKHLNDMNKINKKRRVRPSGKNILLKDQTIITTKEIYEQVTAYEKAIDNWRNATEYIKRKSGL